MACGTICESWLTKQDFCDEEGNNSLAKGYACVDVKRDNVPLAQYLGAKRKLAVRALPKVVYYPFGCNASQQAAVEAALCHQVSIVQGPPGTGKTQDDSQHHCEFALGGQNGVGGVEQ